MKDDLNKLHEDIIKMKDQKSNVNAMWTHFQTKLEKSIDVNVPKQIARKKDGSPWITPDILYERGIDGIKGRQNLEIVEMKPNLKNLNNIHREKSGKRTGNTSTV